MATVRSLGDSLASVNVVIEQARDQSTALCTFLVSDCYVSSTPSPAGELRCVFSRRFRAGRLCHRDFFFAVGGFHGQGQAAWLLDQSLPVALRDH